MARAAQDPARRDAQLCRDRRRDRPAQGGPRGRHRQWRQPCRGADPVPPRDPQRRHARRLCRRARPQAQAARGRRPSVGERRSCRWSNKRLPLASPLGSNGRKRGGAHGERGDSRAATSRCGGRSSIFRWWRCSSPSRSSSSRHRVARSCSCKFAAADRPASTAACSSTWSRSPMLLALYKLVIASLGEHPRDDLPRPRRAAAASASGSSSGSSLFSLVVGVAGAARRLPDRRPRRLSGLLAALIATAIVPRGHRGDVLPRHPVPLDRGVRRQLGRAAADLGAVSARRISATPTRPGSSPSGSRSRRA